MILYKNTFPNVDVESMIDFPVEDQYYAKDDIAVVADGITRDPIGVFDLLEYSFLECLKRYPNPSGAELAAKEIVKTFKNSTSSLKKRLIECNLAVKKLNQKYIKECDYLQNDYYGAVASSAWIVGDHVEYAYICDSGVIIYDKDGFIKFQTEDDKEIYSDPSIRKIGIPWNQKEARVIVRRDFRNNLSNVQNGTCVSYGALTGEDDATHFIRFGSVPLDYHDTILVYTDGFTNLLHEKEFISHILHFNRQDFEQYIENICKENSSKYGKEKTLVIMKKSYRS